MVIRFILLSLFIITVSAALVQSGHSRSAHMERGSTAPASLCSQGERVVWSCETVKQRKLASICSSKDLDRTRGYVQYRFGRVGQVELEYPRERSATQTAFRYSRYTRPLVTYLKLEFSNEGVSYTISDDSNSEEKPARRDASITVKNGNGNKEISLRCRMPVTGSLMKLEDVVRRED